jgi:simple sugar transport system ATP-binding protein
MGDNGAGKSTLVKIIAGNFPPSRGEIRFDGNVVHFARPIDARAVGIEVVYQDLALADNLTAAANVFLGRELKRRLGPFALLDHKAMAERALELFAELRSETRPYDLVKQMSGGQRQAVAIARAVYWNARLMIMDEPTAALGVPEQRKVLGLVRTLRERGVAIIIISHNLQDVLDVADRVVVMRRGRVVGERLVAETNTADLLGLMLGAERFEAA